MGKYYLVVVRDFIAVASLEFPTTAGRSSQDSVESSIRRRKNRGGRQRMRCGDDVEKDRKILKLEKRGYRIENIGVNVQ